MRKIKLINILFLYMLFSSSICMKKPPPMPACEVSVANSSITVTANVSGEEGTQITPDVIDLTSITTESGKVTFKVHKVGQCHEVIDYGHVYSDIYATPTLENAYHSNYGSNVNFGDEVTTLMQELKSNRKYYVRGYVQVKSLEDETIKTLYNDHISTFTTLSECNDGEMQIFDDSDRQTIAVFDFSNPGAPILSFEIVKEKFEDCIDGNWVENYDNSSYKNQLLLKNLFTQIISCDYIINYKLLNLNGSVFTEWNYYGTINGFSPGGEQKIYLNNNYGNIHQGVIQIVLSNIIYG